MKKGQATCGEITYAEIAEEAERAFGKGSVGLGREGGGEVAGAARATFVRACQLLVVKQRCEAAGLDRHEQFGERLRVSRRVRRECSALLGVGEDEAFRLHHRAAGLRAKDAEYRDKARKVERPLAEGHGMAV